MQEKTNHRRRRGFTLVELLVILVIIAILASLVVPILGAIQRKAKMNKSLLQAKQISLSLLMHAADNEGAFPEGDSANEAFAKLVPDIETEVIFHVPGSAWHGGRKFQNGPDNLWETSDPPGKALEAGENHYAYSTGLNDSSPARLPLIASGFSKDQVGVYSRNTWEHGGVWAGKNCVVIYCDGSGDAPALDPVSLKLISGGVDVFAQEGVKMVNPLAE